MLKRAIVGLICHQLIQRFEKLNVPNYMYIIFKVFWRFHINFSQYLFYELCFASAFFSVNCNFPLNEYLFCNFQWKKVFWRFSFDKIADNFIL